MPPINSEPLAITNSQPASSAIALANVVFPVPGGPVNMIPFGNLTPYLSNSSVLLIWETKSLIS